MSEAPYWKDVAGCELHTLLPPPSLLLVFTLSLGTEVAEVGTGQNGEMSFVDVSVDLNTYSTLLQSSVGLRLKQHPLLI